MAYSGDICVNTGSYTDSQGNKKNRYDKIGAWFTDAEGRISINISMIPLIPPKKEDGVGFWANLFHQQNKVQGAPAPAQQQPAPQQQTPAPQGQTRTLYDANGNPVSVPF